jgi:two-component system chemotaxis response regulator CheB
VSARIDSQRTARAVVVIGFSAGGLFPLRALFEQLQPVRAAIVIAHHAGRSVLPELLTAWSTMPSEFALDGEGIEEGRIYVCPPQRHLVINPDATLRLSARQRVNFVRPSIDWLLESAAATYLDRAIAVVLSGGQRDGAKGAHRIRANGGYVIVQEPRSAAQPGMPLAAAPNADLIVDPNDLGRAVSFAIDGLELNGADKWEEPFKVA